VVVSPDGLAEEAAFRHTVPWSRIKKVIETKDFFLFSLGRGFRWIPKRALSRDEIEGVRKLVLAHGPEGEDVLLPPPGR
jgi:hypothetical protein